MTPFLLKLHRWIALLFALPLAAVILSGLVLSFEPALKAAAPPGSVTEARLLAVLDAAGPQAARAALFVRGYEGTATVGGRGRAATFDLATAGPAQPGPLATAFRTARQLHETLLLDLGWLVTASTVALLLLLPLGLLLGWERPSSTLRGWHRASGWFALPLLVASPATGLMLALGLGFSPGAPPQAQGPAPTTREVVRMVAERHDLSGLDWIRPVGGRPLVRLLDETGTTRIYRATAEGLVPQPRPWVRILHEGTWLGLAGSVVNLVVSLVLAGLLATGVLLWGRRALRRAFRQKRRPAAA
ncbi:MAG: PepSY domain-containing protein [Acetobacteraceae bacterium]|nr:PepSY domain-containing protein [Acetobacteraceae bacterium]